MLAFFQRQPWVRRISAAAFGLGLGLLLFWGGYILEQRALARLAEDFRQAHLRKDSAAMEKLFCWERVNDATRKRLRLVIAQEQEWPVGSVEVRPLSRFDHQAGGGHEANLAPAATLLVTYATPDRLTASYLVGRSGWFDYQLAVIVPSK